jgi:hypothetical protein
MKSKQVCNSGFNTTISHLHTLQGNDSNTTLFPISRDSFRSSGYLDAVKLLDSTIKVLTIMNKLTTIGLNPRGLAPPLITRFYTQAIHAQLKYDHTIN